MSYYQKAIREHLDALGFVGIDGQQVESWMRLEHGTLDHLDKRRFKREVKLAAVLCRDYPTESAELTRSI
jgi:hypothetical protein